MINIGEPHRFYRNIEAIMNYPDVLSPTVSNFAVGRTYDQIFLLGGYMGSLWDLARESGKLPYQGNISTFSK